MKDETAGKCPFGFGSDDGAAPAGVKAPTQDGDTGYRHMGMATGLSRDKLPELRREPIEPGADGLATGRCLCGKVSFQIKRPVSMVFANHDAPSRRRSGGVAFTIMIRATNTAFSGWGHLVHYAMSERDTSCFCRVCGTPMFVRHVQPAAMDGMISLSAGALDDPDGLHLAADLCADEKPEYYTFEGERREISSADVETMFASR
ncbi:MAG: GFA family protein [Pseudomonadota bacterium]